MAPPPLQLAGIAAAVVGVALAIAAVSTQGWVVQSWTEQGFPVKTEMGLFKTCAYLNDEEILCLTNTDASSTAPTCSGDHTLSDDNAYIRAMQAMCIIAILIGVAAVGAGAAKASGQMSISAPVDGALSLTAAAVALITFVLFAVFYGTWAQCGTSMCDGSCDGLTACTCGLNYSFVLCGIAFACFAIGGISMLVGGSRHRSVGLLPGDYA